MPSKSAPQARLMRAAAHSPEFAKKVHVPQAVARDFVTADKGRTFKDGGMATKKPMLKGLFGGKETYGEELKEAKAIKSGKITPQQYAKGEKTEEAKMKPKKFAKGGGVEAKGKTRGKCI